MNEKSFKPLFMKTLDWGLPVKSATGDSDKKVLMFKLINALLDKLKVLSITYQFL